MGFFDKIKRAFGIKPKEPPPPPRCHEPLDTHLLEPVKRESSMWLPGRPRTQIPAPTPDWSTCPARMGFNGRLIPVPVMVNGVQTVVHRPLRWLKQIQADARRQRRRSGPKVVRADTDMPQKTAP